MQGCRPMFCWFLMGPIRNLWRILNFSNGAELVLNGAENVLITGTIKNVWPGRITGRLGICRALYH